MKKTIRIIALILAALTMLLSLIACGKQQQQQQAPWIFDFNFRVDGEPLVINVSYDQKDDTTVTTDDKTPPTIHLYDLEGNDIGFAGFGATEQVAEKYNAEKDSGAYSDYKDGFMKRNIDGTEYDGRVWDAQYAFPIDDNLTFIIYTFPDTGFEPENIFERFIVKVVD